jgi:HKD family nuclease
MEKHSFEGQHVLRRSTFNFTDPPFLEYSVAQMAKIDFVLQAVTDRFHADELRKLLSKPDCVRVLASVAFVRQDGVDALAASLQALAHASTFFVGIRNGVTSVQGLRRLLDLGVRLVAVDTASRAAIFHPKLFLAEHKASASLLVGSANLTFTGLHNNIEVGAILDLDLSQTDDKNLLTGILKTFQDLPSRFPENVFHVKDHGALEKLFNDGRLVDEDIAEPPPVAAFVRKGARDTLPPMRLPRHTPAPRKRAAARPKPRPKPKQTDNHSEEGHPEPAPPFALIWESLGLSALGHNSGDVFCGSGSQGAGGLRFEFCNQLP